MAEDLIREKLKEFLESHGWTVFSEFRHRESRCRFDLYAVKNDETLIVEIKSALKASNQSYQYHRKKYGPYSEYKINASLFEALGQAIWYSQYADTVWLVVPTEVYKRLEQMTIDLPSIKFFSIERWLSE
jgi:hypothetical protein